MLSPVARCSLRSCVTVVLFLSFLSCSLLLYRTLLSREVVGVKPKRGEKMETVFMNGIRSEADSADVKGSDGGSVPSAPHAVWTPVQNSSHYRQQKPSPGLGESVRSPGSCSPRTNVVFVKVHKAGSTTVTCILQRLGHGRNLTFMLPRNHRSDLGWPNLLKFEDYIPSVDGRFNLVVDHTVYNRQLMDELMPNDTVYIAVLRHPLAHIKSVFNWYRIRSEYGIQEADPLGAFLADPGRYEDPYVTSRRHREPHSLTKNFMAFDLGFPLGLSGRRKRAKEFVRKIDQELDFVLILEHLNESLVMLRRLMCWTTQDILYDLRPKNLKSYPEKFATSAKNLEASHRKWSNVDYELYEHFNKSLWKRVATEGRDFVEEVSHFEKVVSKVAAFCDSEVTTAGKTLYIEKSRWAEAFAVDPIFCTKLQMQWKDWYHVLKKTHRLPTKVSDTVVKTIAYPGLVSITKQQAADIFEIKP